MRQMAKSVLQILFRIPEGCPIPFGIQWRLRKLTGRHWGVPWPLHCTSTVRSPERVKLGVATFPGDSPGCYIQATNGIEIGDHTNLGPGVGLISANHDPLNNNKWLPSPPIRLGAHCWLGMHAVILPGVTLGDHTTVGAGAVVTKSFPEGHCVIAGNPARKIKDLNGAK
ncbi:hypothetical protein BH09SUM1_BH09SUM1_12410 [soil metagenome]